MGKNLSIANTIASGFNNNYKAIVIQVKSALVEGTQFLKIIFVCTIFNCANTKATTEI